MLILCVFTSGSYLKLCKFNFFVTFDKDNVCTDLLVFRLFRHIENTILCFNSRSTAFQLFYKTISNINMS